MMPPLSYRLVCPNGHELVVEAALIGSKVRCPACKLVMLVPNPNPAPAPTPAGPPPIPPHLIQKMPLPSNLPVEELEELIEEPAYEDDRPRKSGMKTRKRMRLVNVGLAFHLAKLWCLIAVMLLYLFWILIVPLILGSGGLHAGIGLSQVILWLILLLFVARPFLGATGSLLCFWVPTKARARLLIIVSFSLEVASGLGDALMLVLGPLLALTAFASGSYQAVGALVLVMFIVVWAAGTAGYILFMLFLRAVAYYLRENATAEEAMRLLILSLVTAFGGGLVVFGAAYAVVKMEMGRPGFVLLTGVWLAWAVAGILVLIGILKLLLTLRACIKSRWR